MATNGAERIVDADGHVLEHPTAMLDYIPAKYREECFHIVTRDDGSEWLPLTMLICGGTLERFPKLKIIFLEANGGWIVPWLERLDHHQEIFAWDVPQLKMKPSEYFKRQCWISFDPDESTLRFTAESRLVGADRIIWASDYPHPDAKIPGVVAELRGAMEGLSAHAQARILGMNAVDLYSLPVP